MSRFFRPGSIVRSSDFTWLVDESWPVAAVVSADGSMSLVSWPWPRVRVDPQLDHIPVADGVGIVVRDGDQVVWARRDGCTIGHIESDLLLTAADSTTAWFIDWSDVEVGDPPAPPPPLPPGRIVALARDGSRTDIPTDAPVVALAMTESEMTVTTAASPITHARGRGSWGFEYPKSVVRVERSALLTAGLPKGTATTSAEPTIVSRPHLWTWLRTDPETILRCGITAGQLVWAAGAPTDGDRVDRQVIAVGHDDVSGQPVVRVSLGLGEVGDMQAVGDELWLSVRRRRHIPGAPDRGVDVLAVSDAGEVRTIYPADSIDISRFAPTLHRPLEEELRQQIDGARRQFDDLEHYWQDPRGDVSPLSDGLSESAVIVEDEWPRTRVVVTFKHRARSGLVLRRTLEIFDDEGRPIDHQYASIYLMEDLDTGHIAPASDAVDGVLDT